MKNIDTSQTGSRVTSGPVCEHCHAAGEHEPWCITRDPNVLYAYRIVAEPKMLSLEDTLILHSLGVQWSVTQK
ncbi:MAG TPA: hypothetical protein VMB66_11585 [Candidatus Acidoferrales bacterium]|jgi:hypothetical protein|nr:hypothetical protein [Candidatus Acidoferrales bacterium]